MPYRRLLVSGALLTFCAWGFQTLRTNLARKVSHEVTLDGRDPVLAIFNGLDGRALDSHSLPASGPDKSVVDGIAKSPLAKAYYALRPERSLLLYDCEDRSPWCGRPELNFQAIMQEAAQMANPATPDAGALWKQLYTAASAGTMDPVLRYSLPFQPLEQMQLHLLAIANRMDKSTQTFRGWSGGEIHFIFGPVPHTGSVPTDLTLNFEFEIPALPPDRFVDLGNAWGSLSTIRDASYATTYFDKLLPVLRASGFALNRNAKTSISRMRLRINQVQNAGQWRLSQLNLEAGSGAFVPTSLTDQIKNYPDPGKYRTLWQNAQSVIGQGQTHYPISGALLEKETRAYTNDPTIGMATPPGVCQADVVTRNVLALQQCTFCHTSEGGAAFKHVENRAIGKRSRLSGFMAGQHPELATNLHPNLVDLYYGNRNVVWNVPIHYRTYFAASAGGPCTIEGDAKPIERQFHDVARWTLFLAAIQTGAQTTGGRAVTVFFSTPFTE